jgi:hypothetical protein
MDCFVPRNDGSLSNNLFPYFFPLVGEVPKGKGAKRAGGEAVIARRNDEAIQKKTTKTILNYQYLNNI